MFSTLESTWDRSARRGWSAFVSFTFQALALSLLLVVPTFWIQSPPRLQWLQPLTVPAVLSPAPPAEQSQRHYSAGSVSNLLGNRVPTPQRIPIHAAIIDDQELGPPAPYLPNAEFGRERGNGVPYGMGDNIPVSIPRPPLPTHPPKVSHWAEGNLVYRVQPVYPPLARQVRVQGPVHLQAIISKTGTIEHLTVVSGHPMLVKAAMDAVQQWRYRPYLLNNEPVEIETEITVNFVLSPG
jgi:periplasmic protein TonB